jgi:PAS domain S-box-containing protein
MEPRRTAWLPRLGAREGNPLFVVSGSDTLDVRLQAVRLGAQRFFTLPVDPAVLVDALAESCTGIPPEPYRVLVAGRDPVLSRFFAQLLEDAGMQAVVAAGAEEALQAIYRFQPELIFAGADLGECAGAEFARIVRQQDKFSGIAVMLAAPGEGSVPASDAAGACADDLIATPISPARFVAAVSARVTRFRTLGRMTYSLLSTRRELENQQRAIDRHSALSITDCDGRFVFVNELFCSLSGYGRHELLGRHIDLLASELHEQAFFTRMLDTLREGTIWHGEICKRRKDGGLYWVSATVTPCADVSGGIYQYVVIENDVTERVRAERQLLEARDAALGASQAKSAFLSSLSHELRTPLNAIIGYSQMLRDSGADLSAGRVADHAGAIARAGNHLLEIINDLLDLSRIEARQLRMDPGQVPVTALLDDCCALVAPLARAREIRIDRTGDETRVPLLQADPVRLKQVLVNLLSNAVKYNRQGGTVAILVAWDGAGQCRIEVTDSGAGIPPEFLPDLFRPFSRLPAHVRHEGAGIGLALCRELMTLMEGEIGVRSNPGQGSTFWITVPVAGTAGTATENVSGPAYPAAALARGTILYVEDTPVNALLVEQILSHRTGHVLRHASDLEGGLRMARTQRPDLILLDLQLPAAGGLEAIARLRQDPATHAVPVVAVAGLADDGVRAAALAAGCAGFLVKPVEVAALCSVVGRLLGDGGAEAG